LSIPLGDGLIFLTGCELNRLWLLPYVKPFPGGAAEILGTVVDISAKLR
jgi:hypothetical protein